MQLVQRSVHLYLRLKVHRRKTIMKYIGRTESFIDYSASGKFGNNIDVD